MKRILFFDDNLENITSVKNTECNAVFTPFHFNPNLWYDIESLPICTEKHFTGLILKNIILNKLILLFKFILES